MVMRFLKRGSKAFTSQQHTILSAAAAIAIIYGLSAVMGFIRNRLLSGYFGDSPELGIYFAADDIPSLTLSLIVSGSLSAAFIPVFTKQFKQNEKEAWSLTSSVLNISLVLFAVLAISVIFGANILAREIIARDSSLTPERIIMLANLMRIMMLAQLVLIFSSFFTSILQSFKRFVVPAFAPVMYNVGIIIFLLLFAKPFGIYAPAWGMVFGSILHMLIQYIVVRKLGFIHKLKFEYKNLGVRKIYKLMIPRTIGQAAQKLLDPLYTNLALFISAPSNVILTFATDIQTLPVRIFGMSIGQAALPILANAYKDDDESKFKQLLIKTIHQVVFFVLPASVIIFILRVPLVRLTVGASKYSWEATVMTAYTLGFYSISLVAQSLVLILARGFYVLHNTKTPLKIGIYSIIINAILGIIFVRYLHLGVWSLALAYSIGSIFNAGLLFFSLSKKMGGFDFTNFIAPVNKIGFASLLTGVALYIPLKAMDALVFDTTRTLGLLTLTGTVSVIGFFSYIFFAWMFKIEELGLVFSSLKKMKKPASESFN